MKKGISLYFGKIEENGDFKRREELIKKYNFNAIMTSAGLEKENGKLNQQVKYAKKIGLELTSLHSSYISKNLHYFWEEGKEGEKILKNLIKELKLAKKYGFICLVVHTEGKPSKIGISRFEKLLKLAHKVNVPLAIENLGNEEIFNYLFENLGKDDMLKVCYDSGHEHAFIGQDNFLEQYLEKIVCLHLHDNIGNEITERNKLTNDMHSFIGDGTVDFDRIAKLLSKIDVSLDLELLLKYNHNYSYDEILDRAYKGVKGLEEKIEMYKTLNI